MYQYTHGGNAIFEKDGRNILDLSANINPLGFPENVEMAIRKEIEFSNRYPDNYSKKLRESIAAYETVNSEWIFCGNGASDIIFRLPICVKPKNVLLLAPTFSDYERSASSFGADVKYHVLEESKGFALDGEITASICKNKIDLVYICNPNNPTGVLTERSVIEKLLACCKEMNAYIVVDECFIDFTEQAKSYTCKPLLSQYDNLIILKAFTKIFALPGIRLGYAMCSNRDIIERLYFNGADWTVSNIAQAAGIASLENASEYIRETVKYVTREREYIKSELEVLGYKLYDSRANYVFFKSDKGFDLAKNLNEHGIRIRHCDNFRGLSAEYYRVGISKSQYNRELIKKIREI